MDKIEPTLKSIENLKPTDKIIGIEMRDQPLPSFTMQDLVNSLAEIYGKQTNVIKKMQEIGAGAPDDLKDANGIAHTLFATVTKLISGLDSIHSIPPAATPSIVNNILNTERPVFSVCGVQLWENGAIVGVSLYSTIHKAKTIRNILNAKFAELNVKHEAKIINYPVF